MRRPYLKWKKWLFKLFCLDLTLLRSFLLALQVLGYDHNTLTVLSRPSWRVTWNQDPLCSTAATTGCPVSGHWSARPQSPAAWKTPLSSCSSVWISTWWWQQRRSRTSSCPRNTLTPSHISLSCGYSLKLLFSAWKLWGFFFFFNFSIVSLLSNVFIWGLYFYFFAFLYILYQSIYETRENSEYSCWFGWKQLREELHWRFGSSASYMVCTRCMCEVGCFLVFFFCQWPSKMGMFEVSALQTLGQGTETRTDKPLKTDVLTRI